MSRFFCDTNSELWYTRAEELNVGIIKMPYTLGSEMNFYDFGKETDCKGFFDAMRKGESAKTQALNMDEYIEYFEPVFASGEDVLYVTFSQKMSGTFNSMRLALEHLREKYPERTVTAVDTEKISYGAGIIVEEAAKLHAGGASDADIVNFVEYFKHRISIYFTVADLKYLVRGGRISAVAGAVGNILNLKPVIGTLDGKLVSLFKVNGRKKSIYSLVEKLSTDGVDTKYPITILQADSEHDAGFMKDAILQKYPDAKINVQVIGPVIGAHCGPDTLGLVFVKKDSVTE